MATCIDVIGGIQKPDLDDVGIEIKYAPTGLEMD